MVRKMSWLKGYHKAPAAGFDQHFKKPFDYGGLTKLLAAPNQPANPSLAREPPPPATLPEIRPMLTLSRHVEIVNAFGLHLRAADKFVRLAGHFQADVQVAFDGRKASGRSILDLSTLAAACGSRLELETAGPDAEAAMNALTSLIESGFDEGAAEPRLTAPGPPLLPAQLPGRRPSGPLNCRAAGATAVLGLLPNVDGPRVASTAHCP